MKPRVTNQGKAVIELDQADGGFIVMLPDGQVVHRTSKLAAMHCCQRWFRTHNDPWAIGVGRIEWRGIIPPLSAGTTK
jgi:hypothetical protein